MFILGYSFAQQTNQKVNTAALVAVDSVTPAPTAEVTVTPKAPKVWKGSTYVQTYGPLADELEEEYGVPAEVILGVAILESGSGTSKTAKTLNNHFGIVGKNKLTTRKSIYKQYESVADSYEHFCKIVAKKKACKDLNAETHYRIWVDKISKSGYSEVPDIWKERVLSTIKKNKLAA
jgi:flagellum-specific peptidoglycan hydrolase FlgJ